MLALSGIGVTFGAARRPTIGLGGVPGLDDVSLTVPDGAVVGVIGPNGAGKTTLLNVVCGFVTPSRGSMTLDGAPLRPRPHRLARLGIARTLQGIGLFDGLSVLENVMAGASTAARAGVVATLLGLGRADERALRERAWGVLEELALSRYGHAAPGTLPFALRKKVALARALAGEPRLLLLDEPAGGLAADEVEQLAAVVAGLPSRRGCSVLLVEHHRELVLRVCDAVVVLDLGRVVAAGPPAAIRDHPAVAAPSLGGAA